MRLKRDQLHCVSVLDRNNKILKLVVQMCLVNGILWFICAIVITYEHKNNPDNQLIYLSYIYGIMMIYYLVSICLWLTITSRITASTIVGHQESSDVDVY